MIGWAIKLIVSCSIVAVATVYFSKTGVDPNSIISNMETISSSSSVKNIVTTEVVNSTHAVNNIPNKIFKYSNYDYSLKRIINSANSILERNTNSTSIPLTLEEEAENEENIKILFELCFKSLDMSDDAETLFKEIIRLKEKLLVELNPVEIEKDQSDLRLGYRLINILSIRYDAVLDDMDKYVKIIK